MSIPLLPPVCDVALAPSGTSHECLYRLRKRMSINKRKHGPSELISKNGRSSGFRIILRAEPSRPPDWWSVAQKSALSPDTAAGPQRICTVFPFHRRSAHSRRHRFLHFFGASRAAGRLCLLEVRWSDLPSTKAGTKRSGVVSIWRVLSGIGLNDSVSARIAALDPAAPPPAQDTTGNGRRKRRS